MLPLHARELRQHFTGAAPLAFAQELIDTTREGSFSFRRRDIACDQRRLDKLSPGTQPGNGVICGEVDRPAEV